MSDHPREHRSKPTEGHVARLRRDNARLRKWLRYMERERATIVYQETMPSTRLALLCQAALKGDAPPKGGKR